MTYRKAKQHVERLGMEVEDGLGFTVAGGLLVSGEDAPPAIAAMNGWSVEEIAAAVTREEKAACP
jgi:hypothetical protein